MGEDTVEEPTARLCLEPCPRCRAAKFSGGAGHLPSGQTGSHESRAVSGEIHRFDLLGTVIGLLGVAVIMYWPR